MDENNEDDDLFGEDIAFSKESVDKRLGKVQKKTKITKKKDMNNLTKQKEVNAKVNKDNDNMKEESDDEEFVLKANKKKARKIDSYSTRAEGQGKGIGMNNERISEIITIEDEGEKTVIKLNIKVYKKRESEIVVIKTLIVALYKSDSIKKLVTYISKNLNPKPANHLEDIKVYFDGDHVNMDMKIKEIGIENEEQLEVKVPFECNWN